MHSDTLGEFNRIEALYVKYEEISPGARTAYFKYRETQKHSGSTTSICSFLAGWNAKRDEISKTQSDSRDAKQPA